MSFNTWTRQIHRWLSILFTLAVGANLMAVAVKHETTWIGLCALFPLILLLISGLYLFVLPYVSRAARTGGVRA